LMFCKHRMYMRDSQNAGPLSEETVSVFLAELPDHSAYPSALCLVKSSAIPPRPRIFAMFSAVQIQNFPVCVEYDAKMISGSIKHIV
jgi:hypothetical protein